MGTFRALSNDDLVGILGSFAMEGPCHARPIAAGTVNTNFAVEGQLGGQPVRRFLRINEGKAQADVEREAAIIDHVAARGVKTPMPLRARDGRPFVGFAGQWVSLFPWVDGKTLSRNELQPTQAAAAGRALAELHLAGADLEDHAEGRYEPDEIDRRLSFVATKAKGDPALEAAVEVLRPTLQALAQERDPGLPLGLIHGDLFIDNVLYDGDRLAALLDFEQASWGRLAYDIAVSVLAFGFGRDDFRADVTRAFIDGYRTVRQPTAAEDRGFAAELGFAACRFAVTRITDVYLRRGAGAPGGKDFGRYLQRLAAVQAHTRRGSGLLRLI